MRSFTSLGMITLNYLSFGVIAKCVHMFWVDYTELFKIWSTHLFERVKQNKSLQFKKNIQIIFDPKLI